MLVKPSNPHKMILRRFRSVSFMKRDETPHGAMQSSFRGRAHLIHAATWRVAAGPSRVSASATSGPDLLALKTISPAAALRASPNGAGHQIRIRLNGAVVLGFDEMAGKSHFL